MTEEVMPAAARDTPPPRPAAASDMALPRSESQPSEPSPDRDGPPYAGATPTRANGAGLLAAVVVLAIIVLVGGYILWNNEMQRGAQFAQIHSQLDDLGGRIGKLEARPAPTPQPPVDLGPLQNQLAALQRSLNTNGSDLAGLNNKLTALDGRVGALENKPPAQASLDDASRKQLADIAGRMDSIEARPNQLGTQEQADTSKLGNQLSALDSRVSAGIKASSEVTALQAQEARTAQLQAATAALAAGRPVGAIPDAPPALAKFATAAPPTEASLRLSFDQAAQQAEAAGQPAPSSMPFLDRMWQRVQSSVTVRNGNQVVVGDALADTLTHARHLLDAGDLAGAVAAVADLTGPAAQAMAPWVAQARSLLDARAALISAARG